MIFVDTHVHLQRCFEPGVFLDSAAINFRSAAAALGAGQSYRAVLCLTEAMGMQAFGRLRQLAAERTGVDGWSITGTGEAISLMAAHRNLGSLIVIAGRQIRCAEGVEVLALGSGRQFDDGMALAAAIEYIHADGAVPVLPWGFGKWTGRRGRVIRETMENHAHGGICLGDNSGRPSCWREPLEFALARRLGLKILPGSDPLPFPAEVTRVASYGLAVPGQLGDARPARDLLELLADLSVVVQPFGRRERPLRFLRNQLAMQFVKRLPETADA
jgi:hypothetical protein